MPDHDIIAIELVGGPMDGLRFRVNGLDRIQCRVPRESMSLAAPPRERMIAYDRTDEITVDGRIIYRFVTG